jgi:hypothetical protein
MVIVPFYGNLERGSPVGKETKKRVRQSVKRTQLGYRDIAHFAGLNHWVVSSNSKDIRLENKRQFAAVVRGRERLSYRQASEIYEARDAGYFEEFGKEQVAELIGISEEAIEVAFDKRKIISGEIVKALDILHPGKKHKKPYLVKGK